MRLLSLSLARRGTAALGLFAAVAVSAPAWAHDFWIEPTTHRPAAKGLVGVTLRVGDEIPGDAVPRKAERIERLALAGPDGDVPVVGREGETPAGAVRVPAEGLHWLVYRSRRSSIRLEAEKYEAYLKEEGLERAIESRAKRGQSQVEGREVYSRCAKSLLVVGGEEGTATARPGFDRVLGLPLELVLERDPTALPSGVPLPFRLLHEGKPVEGALVLARAFASPRAKKTARTDGEGRVEFALDADGAWLVTSVHMVEAPSGLDADWESLWASVTFDRRAPKAAAVPSPAPAR